MQVHKGHVEKGQEGWQSVETCLVLHRPQRPTLPELALRNTPREVCTLKCFQAGLRACVRKFVIGWGSPTYLFLVCALTLTRPSSTLDHPGLKCKGGQRSGEGGRKRILAHLQSTD
ncbi:hypothetical protein V2G26_006350 [Clonostachys chloroleuca]